MPEQAVIQSKIMEPEILNHMHILSLYKKKQCLKETCEQSKMCLERDITMSK